MLTNVINTLYSYAGVFGEDVDQRYQYAVFIRRCFGEDVDQRYQYAVLLQDKKVQSVDGILKEHIHPVFRKGCTLGFSSRDPSSILARDVSWALFFKSRDFLAELFIQ